ncbi:MAG: hypothetical protein JNN30_22065, partial [Rhodanobacteraceae bacterium]|nr:hypothetical protein [Rhodanobacteraceae bacterium]
METRCNTIRRKVLAAAVLTTLGAFGAAASAAVPGVPESLRVAVQGRVNFSALTPGTQNTRFIVHYRDAVAYGAPDAAK